MKFLKYTTIRISLDYDIIHNFTIEEIISLKNALTEIRKMRKHKEFIDFWIDFRNKDFQCVWQNPNIENEFIVSLNSMIINSKLKSKG